MDTAQKRADDERSLAAARGNTDSAAREMMGIIDNLGISNEVSAKLRSSIFFYSMCSARERELVTRIEISEG